MPVVMDLSPASGSETANWIRHIYEPARLILAWQAPDSRGNRTRLAVGEVIRSGGNITFRYCDGTPDIERAKNLGFEGYPAFDLRTREHTRDVMATFMRRLPPRTRSDFAQYLEGLRIDPAVKISDFSLLGYSEAKLPSDGFSLVNPLDDAIPPCEFLIELAGYRHRDPSLTTSDLGALVQLQAEPTNPVDPNAIAIFYRDKIIGYVNRLQTGAVGHWAAEGRGSAVLEKLNGQVDRPRAFIFLRVA